MRQIWGLFSQVAQNGGGWRKHSERKTQKVIAGRKYRPIFASEISDKATKKQAETDLWLHDTYK